jgi:hypothetical protein
MSPIGSFDAFWENFERVENTHPQLISEAKEQVKAGSKAPNWRLKVGSDDLTSCLTSFEVTFTKEGESGMRFVVAKNLRRLQYERARVQLWIGYGTKLIPYFRGRLADPVDSGRILSEASAYGLATQMGQRYFGQRVDYGGEDLRDSVQDMIDRFGADPDRFSFWGTHTTTLANDIGEFGLEVSLLEGLQTILEPMQFIGFDQIGGMYVIKRSHLATLGGEGDPSSGAGHWEPDEYPKDAFTFDQSMANFYSDVKIFRRNETFAGGGGPGVEGAGPARSPETGEDANEYAVYVDKETAGDGGIPYSGEFNVHQGRDYIVADYPGTQEHAERERELLINAFSRGVGSFSWEVAPCDFSIGDRLTVYRHEELLPEDRFERLDFVSTGQIDRVGYSCIVEETTMSMEKGAPGEPGTWAMSVSGKAFENERTTLRPATSTPITLGVPANL